MTNALADLGRRAEACEARIAELGQEQENLRWWLQQTSNRGDETAGQLERALADHASDYARLTRLIASDVRLDQPGGLRLDTFDVDGLGRVIGFRDGDGDTEGVYVAFEDWFRGSEAVIAERQRAYLPLVRDRGPVLDVGCGRGEFLGLLRERGVPAVGIDIDPAMVKRAHDHGFEVYEADAVSYLEGRDAGGLGAVFAAQVIEHLPYKELVRFLRAARATLAPGSLIMETVNPHAPQALKHFWIDPTHQHPLFPEVVVGLCRLTGFAEAYIWYPHGSGDPDRDRLDQLDYAVVARTAGP